MRTLSSLLSSIVVRRRREKNHKQKVKECEMTISARRKEYLKLVQRRSATVMDVVLIPARRLSRRSSKLSNFSKKGTQKYNGRATMDTCIADPSMCIEHIINPVQHRIRVTRRLKIEDSMKSIRRTQDM
jgi:hypothetical protein